MPATDPTEAVIRFVELLRSTVSCITEVPLVAQPTDSNLHHIIFHDGQPVELRTERGLPTVKLSIVHHCLPIPHPRIAGAYTVNSAYFAYEILDMEEAEILVYHWHPAGVSNVTLPHLHVSSRIRAISVASLGMYPEEVRLADMHIFTGRVLVEDVVRLLINDFRVIPLQSDWEKTLADNANYFQQDRSW